MTHSEKVFKTLEDVGELVTDSLRLEWTIKLVMNLLEITKEDLELMGVENGDFRKFIDIAMEAPEELLTVFNKEQKNERQAENEIS